MRPFWGPPSFSFSSHTAARLLTKRAQRFFTSCLPDREPTRGPPHGGAPPVEGAPDGGPPRINKRSLRGAPVQEAPSQGAPGMGVSSGGPPTPGGFLYESEGLSSFKVRGAPIEENYTLEEQHRLFSDEFNEAPAPVDEFGAPSYRPSVKADLRRGPRGAPKGAPVGENKGELIGAHLGGPRGAPALGKSPQFGKPRFNVRGLQDEEALHQPSLWQQLLQQEKERRMQRQAQTARRTTRVLAAAAASAASGGGAAAGTGAWGPSLGPSSAVEGKGPSLGPPSSATETAETPQAAARGALPDWRDLSGLQASWEVSAEITHSQTSSNEAMQQQKGAPGGAPETLGAPEGPPLPPDPFQDDPDLDPVSGGGPPEGPPVGPLQDREGPLDVRLGGPLGGPLDGRPAAGEGSEAELIETESPIARATHAAGMPRGVWERLSPQHLHTQQQLLRAKTPEAVLEAVAAAAGAVGGPFAVGPPGVSFMPSTKEAHSPSRASDADASAAPAAAAAAARLSRVFGLDWVNAATAVHRLGRLVSPPSRASLSLDSRFVLLLQAAQAAVPLLDAQGASNMLWGLTRLEQPPQWLPELLLRCSQLSPQLSPHQVATCLYCLSLIPGGLSSPEGRALYGALLGAALRVSPQLQRPLDLTCICCSLSRLKVREAPLWGALVVRAKGLLQQLSVSELASVSWAFAAAGVVDKGLFAAVQRRVETEGDTCSSGDLVQFAWAFSRALKDPQDLFDYTLTPLIRSCLPNLNARQLATLASAYAQAGMQTTHPLGLYTLLGAPKSPFEGP